MLSRFTKTRKLKEYLEQEKHSYPQIFESSPDILLFVIDVRGIIVKMRGGSDQFAGIAEKIIGKHYKYLIYKEDLEIVKDYYAKVLSGESQYVKYRITDNNGGIIYIDATLVPIQLEDDEIIGFYGLTHNISNEQMLQQRIKMKRDKLQSLIHYSREMIGILDPDGTIVFENPSIESILGFKVEEISGKSCFNLIHPHDLSYMKRKIDEIVNLPNTPIRLDLRLKHQNGETRDFEVICTNLISNSGVKGIVCNFHDITEIRKQQLEIQYMAYHDYLTELPNRRSFEDRLDLEIRLANVDNRKFAVLFLNLDGFTFINDSLGHDIGDLLIIEVARKLKDNLSQSIEMIARIDGDEFAILTRNLQDVSSIERLANEVLQIFEQPFNVQDYNLAITTSIGASMYPESGDDTSSLMKNTGAALRFAEKAGNNKYQIFSPTANVATFKVFTLRNDLKQAFYDNQFLVYYQPIVDTETNQIISVEALLRWNHPDWGIVSPEEFIPIAEESGLIVPIGEWVLRTVCKKLSSWHNAGYLIKASVNLSPVQFLQTNLIDMVRNTLNENNLETKWLELEITESTMLERAENALAKIAILREMGIQISLDDFGTGYASIRNLKNIKPDTLKLDQLFIKELPSDKDSAEIVTSIIQLAKRLGMNVVAEGVETVEQHSFLSALQCDRIQGFLFSRPVSEENFEKLLEGQWSSEINISNTKNRRKYFRINFEYPLEAFMTVTEINGRKVQLGNTKILIEDIGPGGLRFLIKYQTPNKIGCNSKISNKNPQRRTNALWDYCP